MDKKYERNTHFQGSAQQVAYKILDLIPDSLHTYSRDDQKLIAELIAQYAYDLAMHIKRSLDQWEFEQMLDHRYDWNALFEDIPDLTAWPPD